MKKISLFITFILLFLTTSYTLSAQTLAQQAEKLTLREMQSVIQFLGDDLLEGRAPGTRGGALAERYLQTMFKWMNLEPAFDSGYLQPFQLFGFVTEGLTAKVPGGTLASPDDIVGTLIPRDGAGDFKLEAEVVFVGFGIQAEMWTWDDYKQADVAGKIVVARVNDPGKFIPGIFEGNVLTYFGRWTYHIEEAVRRGAAGILLIHTDETAGYGWQVVQNSWSGEEVYLGADLENNLKLRAWIKESSLRKILKQKGFQLEDLYKKSLTREFKPVSLGIKMQVGGSVQRRSFTVNNAAAVIPGKSKKTIVLSSHIDHLGKLTAGAAGTDTIFNGAIDNGAAVAAMMLTAKLLNRARENLYYSVVILGCHAEESGLLGSRYFVRRAPNRGDMIACINFESTPVWGKACDFMGIGARFSTLEDTLKKLCKQEGLQYTRFSLVNQGFFYRSDQFSFARYGIPSLWISAGENDDSGEKKYPRFWKTDYHTVRDEFDPGWTLEGLRQTVKMTLALIDDLNKTREEPRWKNNLTFPLEKE